MRQQLREQELACDVLKQILSERLDMVVGGSAKTNDGLLGGMLAAIALAA